MVPTLSKLREEAQKSGQEPINTPFQPPTSPSLRQRAFVQMPQHLHRHFSGTSSEPSFSSEGPLDRKKGDFDA